jgi:hypothetical protein
MADQTISSRVRAYIKLNPNATDKEVAAALGFFNNQVATIRWRDKRYGAPKHEYKYRKANKFETNSITSSDKSLVEQLEKSDPVKHPAHYKVGGIETIDFIEAKQLNYNLGNVVKYITRAEHKGNQLQDLQKAQWYLAREIERVQA